MESRQVIPAEAVEALARVLAQEALVSADMDGYGWDAENDDPAPFMPLARERAHAYLQAAAPYMLADILEDAANTAETDELTTAAEVIYDLRRHAKDLRPMLNTEGEK